MFCKSCGTKLKEDAKFCTVCGAVVTAPFTPPEQFPTSGETALLTPPTFGMPPTDDDGAGETTLLTPPEQPGYDEIPFLYAPKKPKKANKGLIIALIAAAILVVGALAGFFVWSGIRANQYNTALEALENGEYDTAREMFLSLGSYRDSTEQAGELQELEDAYLQARKDLEDNRFGVASNSFRALGSYKDSREYPEYHIPFTTASYAQKCADAASMPNQELCGIVGIDTNADPTLIRAQLYEYAANTFAYLGGPECTDLADDCYLSCCDMWFLLRDFDTAAYFSAFISDARRSEYEARYLAACSDTAVLNTIRSCAEFFVYETCTAEEYIAFVQVQIDSLYYMAGGHFIDWRLQELAYNYIDGLETELESWDSTGVLTNANYYTGVAAQSQVIETLFDDYGFMTDDPTLVSSYRNSAGYFTACASVAANMDNSIQNQALNQDADGYYVTYTNGTNYTVCLNYCFSFRDGSDQYLGESAETAVTVNPGESVKLHLNATDEIMAAWAYWVFQRTFSVTG